MKKIISGILCLTMMLSMGTVAFAAETNTHELIYQNNASYEIFIPATSNIDITTGRGEIEVMIGNANLEDNTVVSITASSSNYADDSWHLVNNKNANDKISYTIGTAMGGNDIVNGSEVLYSESLPLDTPTFAILYITVNDTSKVGTFTDTITFTSEIKGTLIDFTINDTPYQAVNGMTWEEWVNTEYNTDGIQVYNSGAVGTSGGSLITLEGGNLLEKHGYIIDNGKYVTTMWSA